MIQKKPDPVGMRCHGTPKHHAQNATTQALNSRDERSPSVVDDRVLQRNNLSIRRNDRPGIQHHRASITSINMGPDTLYSGSYRLKHVQHAQRDIEIRHVLPLKTLEVSQKYSSDRPMPDKQNVIRHPVAGN